MDSHNVKKSIQLSGNFYELEFLFYGTLKYYNYWNRMLYTRTYN